MLVPQCIQSSNQIILYWKEKIEANDAMCTLNKLNEWYYYIEEIGGWL